MKKIVGTLFMIILSIYLILMFINMSEDYDKVVLVETFTATENTSIEEEFIVSQRVNKIIEIHVEGYHMDLETTVISINVLGDGSIILCDNCTAAGDEVIIEYNYVTESSDFTGVFIDTIPLIMIVIIIGGIAYVLINKR